MVTSAVLVTVVAVVSILLVAGRRDSEPSPPAASGTTSPPFTTTTTSRSLVPSTTTTTTVETTSPPFPVGLRGQDVTVLSTQNLVVALTFDAGANSAGLPAILRTLAEQHVPATFFLTGIWARANPAAVSAITAAGHRVGNHSMTHPLMTQLPDIAIRDEIQLAEQAIRTANADPRPLFRFPYGDRDARTIAAVNAAGYVPVRWTVDTFGWKGTSGGITTRQVVERTTGSLRPGEIVLMHIGSNPDDGSTLDADALPEVITTLRARGYGFVTLDALLNRP